MLELRFSFRAVRDFIRKQTADFYRLCQEESLSVSAAADAARRMHTPLVAASIIGDNRGYSQIGGTPQVNVSAAAIAREGVRALIASAQPAKSTPAPRAHQD